MKVFSIRSRLIFWIGLMVTLLLSFGSYTIYRTSRSTLFQQIDQDLSYVLSLQALELEIVEGRIYHEWLLDIENDQRRSVSEYVQVWNLRTGSTKRSPALDGKDLPLPHRSGERENFSDFVLPDGHRARVAGKRISPVVEDGAGAPARLADEPFYMAIAADVENAEHALYRLAGTLLLGLVFSLLLSILTIRVIIALSFRPLERLERVINRADVNDTKAELEIPEALPSEVGGLVARYQELFLRISRVRDREREFSSNVAHELRTPLVGVEATLEQALAVEREAADYKGRIVEALRVTGRMRNLVNRLMWFSRLYNGSGTAQSSPVDLNVLIETRLSILNEAIEAKSLRLRMSADTEVGLVETDEMLAGILLNNLIGNAVSHSDPDADLGIVVRGEGSGVCVEISNPCRNFDPAELENLFQPFYRGDHARSGDTEHSGIGLALSREIAKLLGVELDVAFDGAGLFTVKVVFPRKV